MSIKVDLADFEQHYMEFMQSSQHPKLERLNEWGKQRFFLAKYFEVVDDQYETLHVIINYQHNHIQLNLRQAPNFMHKEAYLAWLTEQLNYASVD